jgi:PTS system mannitol-specific IIC component
MKIMKVYVICDAGMGSSALGVSLLKRELVSSPIKALIYNRSIDEDFRDADILVTHKHFEAHLKKHYPNKTVIGLTDFVNKEGFRKVVKFMENTQNNHVLLKSNIRVNCTPCTSDEAILRTGRDLVASGYVEEGYIEGMLDRDHSLSVFMGNKIALPHGEYEFKKFIKKSGIVVHVYPEPIDWHGEQVQLVVGLAGIGEEHVAILANIATVFGEIEAVDEVLSHQDVEIIYDLLTQEEVE